MTTADICLSSTDVCISSIQNLLDYYRIPDFKDKDTTCFRHLTAMKELLRGYEYVPNEFMKVFDSDCNEMIIVSEIDFISFCQHHILPFTGVAHVGYIPNGKIIGLSKIPRIVDMYAKRLQTQEKLSSEITEALMNEKLNPKGVGCIISATHMCCTTRGVKKQNAMMTTSSLKGVFCEPAVKAEFQNLVMGIKK